MNEHRNAPVIADSIGATLAPVGTECQKLPYVPPYVTRLSPVDPRGRKGTFVLTEGGVSAHYSAS
jgi:hypothetical protein